LGQVSWECIEAQADPAATMVEELAGGAISPEAAAVMFPQPSMQPAPAIHRATASASDTRTIRIEERDRIVKGV